MVVDLFRFGSQARRGAIEQEAELGRLAREAYTYLHMPIVAGIVVAAVTDAPMLVPPAGNRASLAFALVACGAPLSFLLGNLAFKWITASRKWPPLSYLIGVILLLAVGVAGQLLHQALLIVGTATTGALVTTAVWEWVSLNGGRQRLTP